MSPKNDIKTEIWVSWLGAAAIGAAALITYAYANFETRDHARERAETVQKQLEEMSGKLDMLLGWKPNRKPGGQ